MIVPALLAAFTRVADDPLGPVAQDPDVARDLACDLTAADAVCSPPIEQPPEPPPASDVVSSGGGSAIGTLLVIVLVAVLLAAIVWLVLAAIKQRGDRENEPDDDLDEDVDDERDERIIDDERPPDRWRRAAAEHRDAGRYRDAVRCEYRGLVGDLARAGIVDEIPGRTSGEERTQLAGLAPDVAPAFDAAAGIFDAAWFNDDEVTSADDEGFTAAERVVLDHVLAGASRGASRRNGSRR